VFPVLGMNLWDLVDLHAKNGLSIPTVRYISEQLLAGVAYMHSRNVIHTDLKPENLALQAPSRVVHAIMHGQPVGDDGGADEGWLKEVLKNPNIRIVDFGNACWTHKHFTDDIQTTQYRAPEVIIRSGYGTPCDMWSVACIVFELATGDQLFHPKSGDEYGKDGNNCICVIAVLFCFVLRKEHFARIS
jgi:serine/threonine-protein kinase SRPK3